MNAPSRSTDTEKLVIAKTSAMRYTPLEMIEKFVSFDTTSSKSNLPLIEFARGYLESLGFECEVFPNETGDKANLLARIGPDAGAGVVLSGHLDTVPVAHQTWHTDAFKLTVKGDKLHGRGTTDMKSFLAICTALAPDFADLPLKEPVYFAMSYDEELGCLGVPSLVKWLSDLENKPRACIVGEPSNMEVLIGHKGVNIFETTVTGKDAHSSQVNSGVSAIVAAAEMIMFLSQILAEMKERGDPTGTFESGFTSLNVGTIEGGTALNIIPRTCRFVWEYRHIPGTDGNEILNRFNAFAQTKLLPRMQAVSSECDIQTKTILRYEGLKPEAGTYAESLALRCAGTKHSGTEAFGTEAGLFQAVGIPTIVCGPGHISQAHQPNEYTTMEQVDRCVVFLRKLLTELRV